MPEEIGELVPLLANKQEFAMGRRIYYTGTIYGINTVVVFSRWGKTAAAATVSALIHEFNITDLIFTGVAGGIDPALNIGDIVIAKRLVQHDMDARPLMPRHEIPLLEKTWFESEENTLNIAVSAVQEMLENKHLHELVTDEELTHFGIVQPRLFTGDIASGDRFFADSNDANQLAADLPTTLCVEMEGAAVAQVCYEYNIPFTVIRTISDTADHKSAIDFPAFIKSVSSKYSLQIIRNIFSKL